MKKKLFILPLSILFVTLLFSETKDDKDFRKFIETSIEFKNHEIENENNLTYLCSGKLSDELYFINYKDSRLSKQGNNFLVITFYTDGKKIESFYSYQYDGIKNNKPKQQNKYCAETKATSFFADFDYDESLDILSYFGEEEIYCGIYNLFVYQDFSSDLIKPYHASQINWTKNRIANIVTDFEDYVQFCIVNQKRGILLKKYFYEGNDYKQKLNFFYWNKNERRYILDENVTPDQLKNASCPHDYFAYNGLKFSMLDSKLSEADLKDLDKSQLRLMRNAIYARHGRTFKSVDLQSLWECYTWYERNPTYSDDLLTETDKYNIELVQKFETGKQ
ncbi:YARHG domain-containing protein [Treponema sp. C6A8]|uniref:YARHG domain-containing protein n=1 Tax=Treponema sp. C6A8 TaxID=1410609 RepID=UPI000480619B|nr:YARHG domain-containing protein [Treponema sp. C6A8]